VTFFFSHDTYDGIMMMVMTKENDIKYVNFILRLYALRRRKKGMKNIFGLLHEENFLFFYDFVCFYLFMQKEINM
jgi:hypothetical protein